MNEEIANLGLRIVSADARTATGELDSFSKAGARAQKSTVELDLVARKLKGVLDVLGIDTSVASLLQMSEEYGRLTTQLRLATDSQQAYALALADVKRIAAEGQQDLAATGALYAQMAHATKALGVSQEQVAAITETVSLATKLSGASASNAATAQQELVKAFAAGTLGMESFNAINTTAPGLMKALADGVGVSVNALQKMAAETRITSDVMAGALPITLSQLQQQAEQSHSAAGATTVLKNSVMEFVGSHAQANGVVSLLAGGIGLLSDNVSLLLSVLGAAKVLDITKWLESATAGVGALTAATGTGAAATGLASRALGLLGGPIGVAVTLISTAAAAWAWYSSSSDDAAGNVASSAETSTAAIIESMEKQVAAMERRNALAAEGTPAASNPLENQRNVVKAQIDQVGKGEGDYANLNLLARQDLLMKLGGQYNDLTLLIERFNKASVDDGGNSKTAQAVDGLRNRLNGVNTQYLQDLKTLQAIREDNPQEYVNLVSKLAKETWNNSEAGRAAADAARESKQAYDSLMKSIRGTTVENEIELKIGKDASAGERARARILHDLDTHTLKLGVTREAAVRAALKEQEQSEKTLAAQRVEAAGIKKLADERKSALEAANAEANANEAAWANFGKSKVEIAQGELKLLQKQVEQAATDRDQAAHLQSLADAKQRSIGAMEKLEAGGTLKQWTDENKRYAIESIRDDKARAAAVLQNEAELRRKQVELVAQGTKERTDLEEQYNTWYSNQQQKTITQYAELFHTGFTEILTKGKAGWKSFTASLVNTFKTTVADQIYKMMAEPFVVRLVGSFLGVAGPASAAESPGQGMAGSVASSAVSSALGLGAAASAFTGTLATGFMNTIVGTGVSAGLQAAGAMAANGAFAAGAGMAIGAIAPYALALYAAVKIFDKGEEKNTRLTFTSNNTPGNISINERGNEGKIHQSYIDGYGTGAFGTFGLSSTYWMDGRQEAVQSFIKTVTKVDDVLSGFLTTAERDSVTAAVTGKSFTAHTGAESANPNASGQLDTVFANRLNAVFEGVSPGLSSLISGFKGTTQELATEAAALLQYRQSLIAGGEAVFGMKVTMQELAALKLPSEQTSAALARLTNEFVATNAVAAALGKTAEQAFGAAGLASLAAREQVIKLSGGLESLAQQSAGFADNYLTEAERLAPVRKFVTEQMAALGLANIDTRGEFKEQVQKLDLTKEADIKQYASLMKLQAQFAMLYPKIESTADAIKTEAELRKQLSDAYDAEHAAISGTLDKMNAYASSLKRFQDSLLLNELSTLTPEQRYQEAKAQFDRTFALAQGGDETAQANLESSASAYLKASQLVNASGARYQDDFAKVREATADALQWAEEQVDVARASLTALEKSVTGLVEVKAEVVSVAQAIRELSGTLTASQLATVGANSTAAIETLYQQLLGRHSDAEGLAFWKNVLAGGTSIAEIARLFTTSAEYQQKHPEASSTSQSFVAQAAPSQAMAFSLRDYGTANTVPLVEAIRDLKTENAALTTEIRELRAEQQRQTGDAIQANYDANARGAAIVAEAAVSAIRAVSEPKRIDPI